GADDPVTIGLSGCQLITNGHVNRLGRDAPVVTQLASLAKRATLSGRIRSCGGPPGTGCAPGAPSVLRANRVAVLTTKGLRLVTVRLHHARFRVYVPAGHYKLELLGRRH